MSIDRLELALDRIDEYSELRKQGIIARDLLLSQKEIEALFVLSKEEQREERSPRKYYMTILSQGMRTLQAIERCLKKGNRMRTREEIEHSPLREKTSRKYRKRLRQKYRRKAIGLLSDLPREESAENLRMVIAYELRKNSPPPSIQGRIEVEQHGNEHNGTEKLFTRKEVQEDDLQHGEKKALLEKINGKIDISDAALQELADIAIGAKLFKKTNILRIGTTELLILGHCLMQKEGQVVKVCEILPQKDSTLQRAVTNLQKHYFKRTPWRLTGTLREGVALQRKVSVPDGK